jgi:hypothetical protein
MTVQKTMTLHDEKNNAFSVTFTGEEINKRLEVTGLSIKAQGENAVVTQKFLRMLPIASATLVMRNENSSGGTTEELEPITTSRWKGTDEQLELVANLYREAYRTGVPIQPYLADKTGRPVTTVNRWVRQARNKGHLGKSNGTRAGEW